MRPSLFTKLKIGSINICISKLNTLLTTGLYFPWIVFQNIGTQFNNTELASPLCLHGETVFIYFTVKIILMSLIKWGFLLLPLSVWNTFSCSSGWSPTHAVAKADLEQGSGPANSTSRVIDHRCMALCSDCAVLSEEARFPPKPLHAMWTPLACNTWDWTKGTLYHRATQG